MTTIEQKIEAWKAANPAVYQWIVENLEENVFAESLANGLMKWGSLTEKQCLAVQRIVNGSGKEVEVDASKIEAAISRARTAGLQSPRLRFGDLRFQASRKDPASIYTKTKDGTYLGRVSGGLFRPSSLCSQDNVDEVREVLADPAAAAVKHGRQYGQCACCGKELSDPESVAKGIGPVCAEKFGF